MNFAGFAIHFGRTTPNRDQTITVVGGFELLDVFHQLHGQVHLGCTGLDVRAVEALDVGLLKNCRHWLDGNEFFLEFRQQALFQHASTQCGFIGVVRENIPAAESDVVHAGDWNVVLNLRRIVIATLTNANGTHLSERANRLAQSTARRNYPCHERGRYRAHAWHQDT